MSYQETLPHLICYNPQRISERTSDIVRRMSNYYNFQLACKDPQDQFSTHNVCSQRKINCFHLMRNSDPSPTTIYKSLQGCGRHLRICYSYVWLDSTQAPALSPIIHEIVWNFLSSGRISSFFETGREKSAPIFQCSVSTFLIQHLLTTASGLVEVVSVEMLKF